MRLVKINDLFDVKYGVNLELINLEECSKQDENSINFVSRTDKNNGISAYVQKLDNTEPNPAYTISVAGGGSVLATFFQQEQYYSGRDIYILIPKKQFSEIEMIFYCYCIRKNKYRYNYGRQVNKTLKDILIPEKMPNDFEDINIKKINTLTEEKILNQDMALDTSKWEYFIVDEIFNPIKKTNPIHAVSLEDIEKGNLPYITRTNLNNGVEICVTYNNDFKNYLNKENCISIGGEGLRAFYQSKEFITGNNITLLYSKNLNKYNALFLNTLLTNELKKKFNYGRGATKERITKLKIKLPTKNNKPDWEFMGNYIKSLPYSKNI